MNTTWKSGIAGGALLVAIAAAPVASAASNSLPAAPSGMASGAASSAAQAAQGGLGQSFTSGMRAQGSPVKAMAQSQSSATTKKSDPVAVYILNPDFVRSGSGPVGKFAYAATSYQLKGIPATIDSIAKNGTWKAANIASGTTEAQMSAKAGGAPLLLEPQVGAWYAVKGSNLVALNSSAQKAVGGSSISLTKYATQVHAKYASMMPGSAYDKKGAAGGFKDAPVATHSASGMSTGTVSASVAGVGLLGAGSIVALRRRGTRRS